MEMGFSGSLTILFLILIFVGFSTTSVADPRTIAERSTCSSTAAVSAAVLADNFVAAMNNLSSLINAQGFGTAIVGKKPNSVFTLAQCFGDLNSTDCILCFSEIRSVLPKCYPKTGGRIFFDGCFGRYENFSFFNDGKDSEDSKNCSSLVSPTTPSHRGLLGRVVGRVSSDAQKNKKGFAVGEDSAFNSTVYVLAQCWQNLHKNTCSSCLQSAASSLISCYPAVEGRAFYAGCFIRYSNKLFWNLRPRSSGKHKKLWIILGCSVFGALLLAGVGVWKINSYLHKKKLGSLRDSYGSGLCPTILNSNLSFKYQDLKKATNNFDSLNKLGQGSYGAVYKGVLPDGRTVAVKRLFINTRQWVDQFFNEVDIIHQLHHKNLVKLLGCSVDGPESLLVYEYYCNRSLDHFIFDANQVRALDWRNRLAIIQGIAEGLYYLHEESEKRIIHRDVKPSNILLDDKFKPKITDFGLARAFTQDQTHLSTGVAGTLGYMAPEYVVHGHLTEKADVYGFGILLLEIVTGQRCSTGGGTKDGESFLPKIWNEFKAKTVKSIMNENVSDDATENEFMHMVQVGLLCTQAAANYRPTMAKVVELLKRNGFEEDVFLTEPPFLDILGSEGHGSGSSYLSTGPSASQCSQDH